MAFMTNQIPKEAQVLESRGLISRLWLQFLQRVFADYDQKINELEARIEALEP